MWGTRPHIFRSDVSLTNLELELLIHIRDCLIHCLLAGNILLDLSADDDIRSDIMKVNRSYPLKELKDALIRFQHHQDRRLTLEYCMLGGVNTSPESADDLAAFCRGLDVLVNLIPWNPVPELGFRAPDESEISAFCRTLDRLRVSYTFRRPKGQSISSACGQLASESRRKDSH